MKNAILKMKYVILFFSALLVFSCTGEDGEIGPKGDNGQDGINGANGINGQDGNANVQTITFDISNIAATNAIDLSVPQITQEILDNDLILVYLKNKSTQEYFSAPGPGKFLDHVIGVASQVGKLKISFTEWNGSNSSAIYSSDYDMVKLLLVKSTNTVLGKSNILHPLKELEKAGIDPKDYNQVVAYFGL